MTGICCHHPASVTFLLSSFSMLSCVPSRAQLYCANDHYRCNCGPWPAVLAAVQLELLALTQPTWSATCASSGSSFAIAGFHSGSHNNALFAEFEHAAEDADQTDSTNLPTQGSSAGSGTGAKRSSRGATAAASGPRQARAAKARQPKGGKGKAGCADSSQDLDSSGQAATAAVDQSAWVCSVMQAAAASCQQPLLLRQACRLLCDAFMAAGAVQAALMYHHISLGKLLSDTINSQLLPTLQHAYPLSSPVFTGCWAV